MSVRNLDALFAPQAIALLGVGSSGTLLGSVLARNLLESGFAGPILPVEPKARALRSMLTYPSVADLPLVPDLAVIASPAAEIPAAIAALGARGCRAAIVVSGGFGEDGDADGARLAQAMLDAARPHTLRIVGPNCLGLLSPAAGLNASYGHCAPKPGNIAFLTQSGLIATSVLDWADARGIGFSHIVSLGLMSDVDFGDLLAFLESDPKTRVILLYVESITEARKFISAARIAARSKPVVVVKAGRSAGGARAVLSHTGALAGSDAVYDAAFRRAGMLRVETLDELFQAVATLATGLRIKGGRLGIVTNGGGLGVMAADAVSKAGAGAGTRLARLSAPTVAALSAFLPRGWSGGNPVDLLGDADGKRYAGAAEALLAGGDVDAVLVLNCPTALADRMEGAAAVAELAKRRKAPVLTAWLGGESGVAARKIFDRARVATYETPERAVAAFALLDDYRRNQELLMETPGVAIDAFVIDRVRGRAIVETALGEGRTVLSQPEAMDLLDAFAIPAVETVVARDVDEAVAGAGRLGLPVVLKILSPDVMHKSDVGGVHLNLASLSVVRQAAEDMIAAVRAKAPEARIDGFVVQPMLRRRDAVELILGIAEDEVFGPVILFGEGGTAVEVIHDRVVGLPPLNDVLARDMISRTRVSRVLAGYRDQPAADRDAIALTLVKLSQLVADIPEIRELDINPLLADASGVVALDARVVLRPVGETRRLPAIRAYPRALEHVATTRKGFAYQIRPIRPEDEEAIVGMLQRSSRDDVRLRFFAPRAEFGHAFAARLTQVDYDREMALVATEASVGETGAGSEILGVVRLITDPDDEGGEFAVMVRSDLKGTGIGYLLMNEILAYARSRGIARVHGEVLRENTTMLKMVGKLGFSVRTSPEDPSVAIVETTTLKG